MYEKEVSLQVLDSKKGSQQAATQPSALTSPAAAVSSGEHATGAVTKKCTKANLHLVLAQCVPHPMPSFHNPNDRKLELSNNWLNFSNSFCFYNSNIRNVFLFQQGGYVLIQTQLKNQAPSLSKGNKKQAFCFLLSVLRYSPLSDSQEQQINSMYLGTRSRSERTLPYRQT